ncbi:hypothetical protein EV361DRAFT_457097 [Lentinula raphanica]|uniref:RlpA-like protein double-psi beta-barrel domain-containing protein n=1 Tax=Lentinula raphanica TaxID=153919 RepID=A0AA38PBA8_9AGAR|nr:hypothetical protein C8R42DRAFT_470165 [Lentinula raphanica]KAJ3771501.1 hypothetical protein FB446DRAFT_102181 [Lentinula raphanica]KAJ3825313.1 hypothetical protein F5880DRAFT_250709 [Lentinula raphanica]KAJ3839768.1 hypothetical protein F5878DRAFT_103971 [Lentinula raphanica]KAJ3967877.1 hypothetical protein EV361DRAFT_457097 [Lentinula raphanica]
MINSLSLNFRTLHVTYILVGLILLLTESVHGQISNGTGLATIIPTGPGPITGACGVEYGPDDLVAGVPTVVFNSGEACSKMIEVTYRGKSSQFEVVDTCSSCNTSDINLAPAAFTQFLPELDGIMMGVTWVFVD